MTDREKAIELLQRLPEEYVPQAVRYLQNIMPPDPVSPEERRARAYALAGKYRDILPSVDEFLAEKHRANAQANESCAERGGSQ